MRILYLADIRFPLERANGIQSMATCHALAGRGHEVTLVVRPDSHTPPRDPFAFYGVARLPGLHVEVAPITGPVAARRAGYVTFAIGRAMGRARQDLIFTRDLGLASLLLRIPAPLRAPVVYEAHGIAADVAAALPELLTGAPAASPAKLERLARRDAHVWKSADGYVTITSALANALTSRFGERSRIAVVPDGAHAAEYAVVPSANAAADKPFTIGYAGHLYPWKGVDLVIEAVAALPDTRGLIVGGHEKEPDLARVKAFAAQLNCSLRVTFTGLIPPAAVAARLRDADVLTLPNPASAISSEFTSPLKLFEYMAAGRPIVASDLPSLREVLRHEQNALLVEPGNPQALVAAIARIKDDPELGRRLAAQAVQDVREFTWARRAERLEAFFAEVTAR
ncbi:MAG TPA: glycosyltransferase family 4 protein [Vicinamibacterales bacterium]|nr:glycosyltransferase family 4 protein [Vicinamibacterales bacterium]